MIDSRTFENLILTNTIVAAFCIVLLITLIGFILVLFVPSLRNRWFGINGRQQSPIADLSSLSRQTSFHNVPSGSSRYNPIFEPTTNNTTMAQFGTLFHPQATTATLLHPTIWTSMTPTSIISSPPPPSSAPVQTTTTTTSTPPTPKRSPVRLPRPPNMTSTATTVPQRSPKKR